MFGGLLGPSKRLCVGTIGLIEFVWVGILRLPDLTCRYSDIINDSNDVGDELGNMYILLVVVVVVVVVGSWLMLVVVVVAAVVAW